MRPWISIAVLAFLLLTASNAFATGKLDKRLMKEGWVKLTAEELKALKDFTASDGFGWAEYIDPSGTKFVAQLRNGSIRKGTREIYADGRYCHQSKLVATCFFLWKRGKYYVYSWRHVMEGSSKRSHQAVGGQFTINPGNTENL